MNAAEANREALVACHPQIAEWLFEHYVPSTKLSVSQSAAGDPTARYGDLLLHSKRDPVREAQRTVAIGSSEPLTACVCFGFGLGYYAEAALSHFEGSQLIIVEPDIPQFLAALAARDVRTLLEADNVTLVLGEEPQAIEDALSSVPPGTIHMIRPQSLYRCDPEFYDGAKARLERITRRREINRNTLARFGSRWIRNLASNLGVMATAGGVAGLQRQFAGVPALVVAAGPSLDSILPHLQDLADHALVIAVDTSLKACLASGVTPDILVVVDPQYWNTRHLDRCATSESVLVSESSTHPAVFRREYRRILMCSSLFPLGTHLEQQLGAFGTLGAGGSVATTAWDLARYAGCGPIYVAGLDLGFPGNQTHFAGSTFEERAHLMATNTTPAEHAAFLALRDAGPYPVPSSNGGEVLTDNRLIIYKWWFEHQIAAADESPSESPSDSQVSSYLLTAGGVKIEGMEPRPLEDLMGLPIVRQDIFYRIDAALSGEDRSSELFEAVDSLCTDLAGLERHATRAMEMIDQFREEPRDLRGLLQRLEGIDALISRSGGKDVASFLMQETIESLSGTSPSADQIDPISQSYTLYESIVDASRFHLDELGRGLKLIRQGFGSHGRNSW